MRYMKILIAHMQYRNIHRTLADIEDESDKEDDGRRPEDETLGDELFISAAESDSKDWNMILNVNKTKVEFK